MRRCMLSKSQAQFRGECCLPVPQESVACSRTLYLSTCPTGRNQGVKGKVYGNNSRTLTALEDNIRPEIGLVTTDHLVQNFDNMQRLIQPLLHTDGSNFQHLI